MQQEPGSTQSSQVPKDFEQMLGDAQTALEQGLHTLTQWSDQARDVLENRPGVVIASVAIAGFVTGTLLRQGRKNLSLRSSLKADPVVMFAASAIAGFAMGPKILQKLREGDLPSE